MRTVAFIELSVFERIVPLVSGYLESYARADSTLVREYGFESYLTSVKVPQKSVLNDVLAIDADVYALSCYVWNMGTMRQLAKAIRAARPHAYVILGGPQVMHHASSYVDPRDERTVVCNGEGEETFAAFLRELTESTPDLSRVSGITFAREGEFVTTDQRPRIADLNVIPSPYLANVFRDGYTTAILETNRGCPYHCGFCFWGAATNDRVHRFDDERVRDEITWMSENGIYLLFIADANWGMLARDLEFSRHIAECSTERNTPRAIYFSAAKNKPRAVTQITAMFHQAGLVVSQPVSMQTLEPRSLEIIARSNIKLDSFSIIQRDLRERNINSYIELIWPLPGETLDSFKNGIGTLCDREAHTVITYPHLLLHNTPIYRDRERLGLGTRRAAGDVAEADIVTSTEQVSAGDFADGMRYFYAMHALHNIRSLRAVSRYLATRGHARYSDIFSSFARYCMESATDNPVARFPEHSLENGSYYDLGNYGLFAHYALHANRTEFLALLRGFASCQAWWGDRITRALFEVDILNLPYIYSNTPLDDIHYPFEAVRILDSLERGRLVEVDDGLLEILTWAVRLPDGPPVSSGRFAIDYRRMQHPYMQSQPIEHNAHYCSGMIEKVGNIMPIWRPEARPLGPVRTGLL